ncbi:hypothetical protein CANCADRAFT_128575 [Tortispora caseinolytica NRRL Y-17796]|uniref:Aldehyde dehydrogenase n=1 Tax=Tortispora caseinolytica NRRL Y-17796 TaxID=767744 RepID=A0A1E4TAK0_9ASCO|nr:hypothetical protein CANCADRAFT_128575 [Tortispora caseinolytica NRRL Y-17796]
MAPDTPVSAIPGIAAKAREEFNAGRTRDVEFRKQMLRDLYYLLYDNIDEICDAVKKDLGKGKLEAGFTEISGALEEIQVLIANVAKWTKPKTPPGVPFKYKILMPRTHLEPLGTVLVLTPWNYPVFLTVATVAAAIAAGDTVVVKMSELAPYSANVLASLASKYLDPNVFQFVLGGLEQAKALNAQKFDLITYTGNGAVAKSILRAAAENLTPVHLELGGKNPAIITETSDLAASARNVAWSKSMNSGQTCTSIDYVLVHESVVNQFVDLFKAAIDSYFPDGQLNTPEYAHIINERHFDRVLNLINDTKGEVKVGGKSNRDTLQIESTLVLNPSLDDPILGEEIFGSAVPVLTYKSLEEAVLTTLKIDDHPLGYYLFTGTTADFDFVQKRTRSGALVKNASVIQAAIPAVPFGGVGSSGDRPYHGLSSLEVFSYSRTTVKAPSKAYLLLDTLFHPVTPRKLTILKLMMPGDSYPRKGRVKSSMFSQLAVVAAALALVGGLATKLLQK